MKKFITLAAFGITSIIAAQAQTTLTAAQFASWMPGTDSVRTSTGGSLPSGMATGNIDLTTLTYAGYRTYAYMPYTNAAFPNASYSIGFQDLLDADPSPLIWNSTSVRGIANDGIKLYGEHIDHQNLAIVTGPSDSVVLATQDVQYSNPRTVLAFPASTGTNWSSDYQYTINTTAYLPTFSIPNATISRVTYVTSRDTVISSASMRVKTMSGGNSGYMDVIAVRSKMVYVDSLMMNGAPASPILLSQFNITQGAVTNTYRVNWYRAGEVTPLLRVTYSNDTYTTPSDNEIHQQRLAAATTSIGDMPDLSAALLIYPNPAAASLTVEHFAAGSFQIVDLLGKVVLTQELSKAQGKTVVNISTLTSGTYVYRFIQNGELANTGKVVINH